jgi:hypothetical protein
MRRILICTSVLGGGTAFVFCAAALTAALVPPGPPVSRVPDVGFQRVMPAQIAPPAPAILRVDAGAQLGGDVLVALPTPEGAP